ncbi:restriction endonuclease subunit S [Streptomyces brevispora]|uniref:restriction endonuclease subunit S n=1 Tax=Streptomyces brevispora TaxID=887462 RepID=UPI00381BCDCF
MTHLRAKSLTRIGWLQGISIPSDWTESKVKYVAPGMQAGEAITAESIELTGTYPVYGGNGLRGYTKQKTHHGTRILIGRQGALCGNVHLVTGEYWASEHAIVARPSDTADARWLAYLLDIMSLGQYSQTAAQPGIGTAQINALSVPVPPAQEQRAIADYLDRETARIDTLIEEQQRLTELQWERRAAVVDAALAPLSSWTRTALKHVLDGIDQGVSPQAEAGLADEPGAWGVLKAGCVNRGVFRPEEHKRLPDGFLFDPAIAVGEGDVIVSRASGSPDLVGSAAIVEHLDYRLILSDKLFRLQPRRSTDSRFLAWSLNSGRYRVQVRRAISGADGLANNLPLSKLRGFEMHFPSLEEQRRIAAYLDDQTAKIDMLIVETERFIALARERRSALITAAVTGQIDVRGVA